MKNFKFLAIIALLFAAPLTVSAQTTQHQRVKIKKTPAADAADNVLTIQSNGLVTDSGKTVDEVGAAYELTPISGDVFKLQRNGTDVPGSSIDLSAYLDDTTVSSATLNPTTGILTATRSDATTFDINLSALVNAPPITNTSELTNDGENGTDPFITANGLPSNLVLNDQINTYPFTDNGFLSMEANQISPTDRRFDFLLRTTRGVSNNGSVRFLIDNAFNTASNLTALELRNIGNATEVIVGDDFRVSRTSNLNGNVNILGETNLRKITDESFNQVIYNQEAVQSASTTANMDFRMLSQRGVPNTVGFRFQIANNAANLDNPFDALKISSSTSTLGEAQVDIVGNLEVSKKIKASSFDLSNIGSYPTDADATTAGVAVSNVYFNTSVNKLTAVGKPSADFTGWAQYGDNQYTAAAPLTITAGSTVIVDLNGAVSTVTSQVPIDAIGGQLYDVATSKITPIASGDGYSISMGFKGSSNNNNGSATIGIDIGGSFGQIFKKNFRFPRGTGVIHDFYLTSQGYALDTFLANGGIIKITSDTGTTHIHDITLQIHRTHKAR